MGTNPVLVSRLEDAHHYDRRLEREFETVRGFPDGDADAAFVHSSEARGPNEARIAKALYRLEH